MTWTSPRAHRDTFLTTMTALTLSPHQRDTNASRSPHHQPPLPQIRQPQCTNFPQSHRNSRRRGSQKAREACPWPDLGLACHCHNSNQHKAQCSIGAPMCTPGSSRDPARHLPSPRSQLPSPRTHLPSARSHIQRRGHTSQRRSHVPSPMPHLPSQIRPRSARLHLLARGHTSQREMRSPSASSPPPSLSPSSLLGR